MRKLLLLIAVIFTLVGCEQFPNGMSDYRNLYYGDMYKDTPLYLASFEVDDYNNYGELISRPVASFRDTSYFIQTNIIKMPNVTGKPIPFEILTRGTGNCDDFAILYMNIMYAMTGEKCNLILVDRFIGQEEDSRAIVEGGRVDHAVIERANGLLIEPYTGLPVNDVIRYRFTFDEVFTHE